MYKNKLKVALKKNYIVDGWYLYFIELTLILTEKCVNYVSRDKFHRGNSGDTDNT